MGHYHRRQKCPHGAQPQQAEMNDPALMADFSRKMGEYSARQQMKLSSMKRVMNANQASTAEVYRLETERRRLVSMSTKLTFSIRDGTLAALSPEDRDAVSKIQQQLGCTPSFAFGESCSLISMFVKEL